MKEFDKWWSNNDEWCNDMTGHFDKRDAEVAWKAALEWVKSEIFKHREPLDVIEEELE